MIELCMRSKQVSLFGQINALNAPKNVNHTLITRITQSLWMSFGSVLNAISTYIINQNITVREQARKLRKEMRCSELLTKAVEICRNDVSPRNGVNRKWQAGGKSRFIYLPPGYNNDPCMLRHTAGCSFYQGQCITNDLWIQNVRSTGI